MFNSGPQCECEARRCCSQLDRREGVLIRAHRVPLSDSRSSLLPLTRTHRMATCCCRAAPCRAAPCRVPRVPASRTSSHACTRACTRPQRTRGPTGGYCRRGGRRASTPRGLEGAGPSPASKRRTRADARPAPPPASLRVLARVTHKAITLPCPPAPTRQAGRGVGPEGGQRGAPPRARSAKQCASRRGSAQPSAAIHHQTPLSIHRHHEGGGAGRGSRTGLRGAEPGPNCPFAETHPCWHRILTSSPFPQDRQTAFKVRLAPPQPAAGQGSRLAPGASAKSRVCVGNANAGLRLEWERLGGRQTARSK